MSQLQDRIAQFRKMAHDDPDNELGHYRLSQLLVEDKQFGEAIQSFRRTLELSPQFSKVYQLLAHSLLQTSSHYGALQSFRTGFQGIDPKMPPPVMADYAAEHGREDLATALRHMDSPYVDAIATLKQGFDVADERGDNRRAGCATTASRSSTSCASTSARNAVRRSMTDICVNFSA
jgi:tetratricopeptide (TPR) repeat protein